MSVGRQLCKSLIDTAAEARRYARLISEFDDGNHAILYLDLLARAEGLEALVPPILALEGENIPALVRGSAAVS